MNIQSIFTMPQNISAIDNDSTFTGKVILETNAYKAIIDTIYIEGNAKGDQIAKIIAKVKDKDGNVTEFKDSFFLYSGSSQSNCYKDKKTGESKPYYGYVKLNTLCLLVTGSELQQLFNSGQIQQAAHSVYDFQKKEDVVRQFLTILPLHKTNKYCYLGIRKIRKNKRDKNPNGTGYMDTNDEEFFNEIERAFNSSGLSFTEMKNGEQEPKAIKAWKTANEGKCLDKFKPVHQTMSAQQSNPFTGTQQGNPFGQQIDNSQSNPFGSQMDNSQSNPFGQQVDNSQSNPFEQQAHAQTQQMSQFNDSNQYLGMQKQEQTQEIKPSMDESQFDDDIPF